jgi:hypothetical protein
VNFGGLAHRDLVEYTNLPKTIATVVSSGKATLRELDEYYGTTKMWWFLEIIAVDNHNQSVLNRAKET